MVFLVLLVAVTAAAIGCDPTQEVRFENQTSHAITVYRFGSKDFQLGPHKTFKNDIITFSKGVMPVEALDESGKAIYSQSFTWDDLKSLGWKIVITEQTVPVRPSPTPG